MWQSSYSFAHVAANHTGLTAAGGLPRSRASLAPSLMACIGIRRHRSNTSGARVVVIGVQPATRGAMLYTLSCDGMFNGNEDCWCVVGFGGGSESLHRLNCWSSDQQQLELVADTACASIECGVECGVARVVCYMVNPRPAKPAVRVTATSCMHVCSRALQGAPPPSQAGVAAHL